MRTGTQNRVEMRVLVIYKKEGKKTNLKIKGEVLNFRKICSRNSVFQLNITAPQLPFTANNRCH